jgi:hypothetical protein
MSGKTVIAHAPPPLIASFAHVPAGWHQFAWHQFANNGNRSAYALSWDYHLGSRGWATVMPLNGIAVTVLFPNDTAHYPRLSLLLPRLPTTTLEGAPDTPEYRIYGRVNGRDVEVWVDIRRPRPTEKLRRLAQRLVAAVRFK